MSPKADVWQGTLALMNLKTLETMGPQHGFGIARRIEQRAQGPGLGRQPQESGLSLALGWFLTPCAAPFPAS